MARDLPRQTFYTWCSLPQSAEAAGGGSNERGDHEGDARGCVRRRPARWPEAAGTGGWNIEDDGCGRNWYEGENLDDHDKILLSKMKIKYDGCGQRSTFTVSFPGLDPAIGGDIFILHHMW